MSTYILTIILAIISPLAAAGGGDQYYSGTSKDLSRDFSISDLEIHSLPSDSSRVANIEVIPIMISYYYIINNQLDTQPITGCVVIVGDQVPISLICSAKTSDPLLRNVIYAFSGKSYLSEGSKFTCIYRCTPKIPKNFERMTSGNEE